MHKTGVFLESGGNKVFFVNGVLDVLRRENIRVDLLAGFSSASPVLLAYLSGRNAEILRSFADKLDKNERNFYLFRRPHFPHDEIYGSSVRSLVEEYKRKARDGHFVIYAAKTAPGHNVTKGILASMALFSRHALRVNFLKAFRKFFSITELRVTEEDDLSVDELAAIIMGSSTIYPFISLYEARGSLVLDGALLEITPDEALLDCEKKIVIHTERGITQQDGNTLHIYADEAIPNAMLDYTNGSRVRSLHAQGEEVMLRNLPLLRTFIGL